MALSEEENKMIDNIIHLCHTSRICFYKKKCEDLYKLESDQISFSHDYNIYRKIKKYNERRYKVLKELSDKYGTNPQLHSIILEEFAYKFPKKN